MARSRSTIAIAKPSLQDVDTALSRGEFAAAQNLAKRLVALNPSQENLASYARALSISVDGLTLLRKQKALSETLRAAEAFANQHAQYTADVAVMLAKGGEFANALKLSSAPRVLRHIADVCVRRKRAAGAPAEIAQGLPLIVRAFQEYEHGQDDVAKETLQQIGLTSPFLEWKVFLRGLMAHAMGDDARALENWQRLVPEYLPAKLASPLRHALDATYAASQPPTVAALLREYADRLTSSELLSDLRAIQAVTGRAQTLAPVWPMVEKVLPTLREKFPNLVSRLGHDLYEAIMRQGEPTDLKKYRTLFSPPADDPEYHRLEAMACEGCSAPMLAVEHWKKYERWLASQPPGWSKPMCDRARANIFFRIGDILEKCESGAGASNIELAIEAFLKPKGSKAAPKQDPGEFYRRSVALAPDWSFAAQNLFDYCRETEADAEALAVAEAFLARQPDDLAMLGRLSLLHRESGRMAEHLAISRRAYAVNPLDANQIMVLGLAYLAAIRQLLIAQHHADCERLIAEAETTLTNNYRDGLASLKIANLRLQGRVQEAAAHEAELIAATALPISCCFQLAIDGLLAKLKPALRKGPDTRLKQALETAVPQPRDVAAMYTIWSNYKSEGLTYRGQPSHEKQILALAERSITAAATENDFSTLLEVIELHGQFKTLLKLAPLVLKQFPNNPIFMVYEVKALVGLNQMYQKNRRIYTLLDTAKQLVEASSRPEHKQLLETIEKLSRTVYRDY